MSKEFAEKNKNKKTPQEIKAEAQAKAKVQSNPTPTKVAPKVTENTAVEPLQKSVTPTKTEVKTEKKATINPNSPEGIKAIHGKDVQKSTYEEIPSIKTLYSTTNNATDNIAKQYLKNAGKSEQEANEFLSGEWADKNRLARVDSTPKFASDEELISHYESIPEYNAFQRLFDPEKEKAYKQKQALMPAYREAKRPSDLQKLADYGVTDEYMRQAAKDYLSHSNNTNADQAIHRRVEKEFKDIEKATGVNPYDYLDEFKTEVTEEYANAHPVLATFKSFGENPGDSLTNTVNDITAYAKGSPIQKNFSYADTARGTVSENIDNGVGKFLYGTVNSIGDMGMAMALGTLTGGGSWVSAGLMGVEKASNVMNEAVERGLDPNQILLEGVASGVTTAVTEKIPMGRWEQIAKQGLTEVTAKEIGKKLFASAFPEALQEMSEDGADLIADFLIAGDKSQINTDIARLMAENPRMTYEEASAQVWKDWAVQTVLDGLGGFISGGAMGGGSMIVGGLTSQNRSNDATGEESDLENAVVEALAEEENNAETPTVDDAIAGLVQNPTEDVNESVNPEEITNKNVSGDEIAALAERELNNATPRNPNNDLASIMDSYVNEQQGNRDITQINPEDTYTSEDVTANDLNNIEDTSDIRERGYSDTVKNKTDAPSELKAQFVSDPSLYRQLHNADVQAQADSIFESGTLDESLSRVQGMIDVKNPVAVPLSYKVSRELVAQGRSEEAVTLTRHLAQSLTEAGQFTQAVTLNMLNNDPIAGREYLERQIDAMNREGQQKFGSKWKDFNLTNEEIERFNNIAEGDIDAINEAYADVWARIGRDYPVRLWDKLQELRRVGLLCNMRTFVRNTVSNIAMLPLRWNAGRITALAEFAYQRANSDYVRTENGLNRISKESRQLAKDLYSQMEEELFGGENINKYKEYNQATKNIQVFKGTKFDAALDKILTKGANLALKADRKVYEYINKTTGGAFDEVMNLYGIENIDSLMNLINQQTAHKDINPSALETIRNFTYYMLGEFGDQPFIKANFIQKLSSYIEANGIKSIEDIPQDAISLAVQEANKATFHDNSNIAQGMEKLRQAMNKISGPLELGNLILTFAKTPGNIGSRMIEYSPIGLGKAAIDSVNANKAIGNLKEQIAQAQEQFDNAQNTQEKLNAQRELERLQKEQSDNYYKMTQALTLLGQGVEGTLGIAIGWLLNKMGFIVGHLSDDKKKRKYEQNVLNKQETSVQIGGTSYSIDFLQPSLSPIVFGAILSECFDRQTDSWFESAKNAGLTVADSWLESTPMKSFSEMFSGYGTASENIFNALIDIPTSWIPSQVGAAARIEDRTMRNTYDKTSTLNTIKNEAIAKIPGLSKTLPASYDLWGRERERQDSKESAIFAQLINPGTTKSENTTDIDEDILNLYDALNGDARVLPHSANTSYSIGGETHKLNNKEVSEYQRIMGTTSYDLAKTYIQSDAWKNAPDSIKAKGLDELYSFAEALAKREVLGAYPQDAEKLLAIYDEEDIDGIKNYFNEKLSYQAALGSAGVEGNATTQKIYENLGQEGVDEYSEALRIAEEKGASKITDAEWQLYRNGNEDAFNKSVESRTLLENNDIDVTEAKQSYVESHGEESIATLKEAEEIAKTIPNGRDKYGNITYKGLTSDLLDILDKDGIDGLNKYKEAVGQANRYGVNNITTDEWKTYRSGDITEFNNKVKYRQMLETNNLSNTQFNRDYIEEYGEESIPALREASEAIEQIQKGVDKYGDAKYFSPNEKLVSIYQDRGKEGVELYADLYTADSIDGDSSTRTLHDTVPYLSSMDMSDAEKGYWLSYFVSGKKVNEYIGNNDYAGLYRYYLDKYASDVNAYGSRNTSSGTSEDDVWAKWFGGQETAEEIPSLSNQDLINDEIWNKWFT